MSRRNGAWLLSAALVAACEPTIAQLPGRPSLAIASPAPGGPTGLAPAIIEGTPFVASPAPSPAGPAAATSPAIAASLAPAASPPPGYPRVLRLRGRVFDDGGRPLAGVAVQVRGLQSELAYDHTVTTGDDGTYQLEDAPPQIILEIRAHKPGFTARRRVAALPVRPDGHTLDFGTPTGAPLDVATNPGAPFFLSNRPEIVSVSPDESDTFSPGAETVFVLELSEPLDAASQDRLAEALRLMPASNEAATSGRTPDLREAGRDDVAVDGDALAWVIRPGTRFPADAGLPAEVTWRSDTQVRFRVPAALLASARGEVRYQLGLVTPPDGARIEDDTFHQLGTDAQADLNGYPPPGHLIREAFRAPDLDETWADHDLDDSGATRWAATHHDTAHSRMGRDQRPPSLVGVEAGRLGGDGVITLIFDEPLVAYDGTATGHRGAGLGATADGALAFTFALGESPAALDALALDGSADTLVDARVGTQLPRDDWGRELAFLAETAHATRENAPPGSLALQPDPRDARRVQVLVVGRPFWFREAGAIKVRVTGFGDPAGNLRTADQADQEQRMKPLPTPSPA